MKRSSAFTLIELLVVIAIIAILAAILFPVFAQAKMAAKKTEDLSRLKQLGLANMMYMDAFDDNFIVFAWAPGSNRDNGPHWADRIQPYAKAKGIFSDRNDTRQLYSPGAYWIPGAASATEPVGRTNQYRVTYAFNHLIARSDDSPTRSPASLGSVSQVASTVLLGPSQNWFTWSTCRRNGAGTDLIWNVSSPPPGSWSWGYEFWGGLEGGYSGGANFAFVDGHAEYSKLTKGGDARDGAGSNGLYAGGFVKARTRPEATATSTCPTDYSSGGSGY